MRRFGILLLLFAMPLWADSFWEVTPNRVTVGDRVRVRIFQNDGTSLSAVAVGANPDQFFVISKTVTSDEKHGKVAEIEGAFFKTGSFRLPTFVLESSQGRRERVMITAPKISVQSVISQGDSLSQLPLAPLRSIPFPFLAFALVFLLIFLFFGLIWLGYLYWARRRIVKIPDTELLQNLDRETKAAIGLLYQNYSSLLASGDTVACRKYYDQLSDLVRGYLSRRLQERLMERTTQEVLDFASRKINEQGQRRIRHVLNFCDEMKFGDHFPVQVNHEEWAEKSAQIVDRLSGDLHEL